MLKNKVSAYFLLECGQAEFLNKISISLVYVGMHLFSYLFSLACNVCTLIYFIMPREITHIKMCNHRMIFIRMPCLIRIIRLKWKIKAVKANMMLNSFFSP